MSDEKSKGNAQSRPSESDWIKKIDHSEIEALTRLANQPEFARETDLFSLLNLVIRIARNSPKVKSLLQSAVSIIEREETEIARDLDLVTCSIGQIESVDEIRNRARCYVQLNNGFYRLAAIPLDVIRKAGLSTGDGFRIISNQPGKELAIARSEGVTMEDSSDFGPVEISDEVVADCEWAFLNRKSRFREFQPLHGDYVAILNRTVVGSGTSESQLRQQLAPIHHVDPNRFVVEYIGKLY